MNIKKIAQELEQDKKSFYKKKEDDLMKSKNLNKYVKTVNTYSYVVDIFGIFFAVFIFILSLFFSIFIFNMVLNPTSNIHFLLTCITSASLTALSLILFRKVAYNIILLYVKSDPENINTLLELEHQEELNQSIVSEYIHDLLKIELSDKDYLDLRNKGLTYQNVKKIITPRIQKITQAERNQDFLNDKHIVSLKASSFNELYENKIVLNNK